MTQYWINAGPGGINMGFPLAWAYAVWMIKKLFQNITVRENVDSII